MFGKKDTALPQFDITEKLEQFAIRLQGKYNYEKDVQKLNEWCYENNCIPLNFRVEGDSILAIVKRI